MLKLSLRRRNPLAILAILLALPTTCAQQTLQDLPGEDLDPRKMLEILLSSPEALTTPIEEAPLLILNTPTVTEGKEKLEGLLNMLLEAKGHPQQIGRCKAYLAFAEFITGDIERSNRLANEGYNLTKNEPLRAIETRTCQLILWTIQAANGAPQAFPQHPPRIQRLKKVNPRALAYYGFVVQRLGRKAEEQGLPELAILLKEEGLWATEDVPELLLVKGKWLASIADTLANEKRNAQAIQKYREAITACKNDPKAANLEAECHFLAGLLLLQEGMWADSVSECDQAVKMFSSLHTENRIIADCYHLKGESLRNLAYPSEELYVKNLGLHSHPWSSMQRRIPPIHPDLIHEAITAYEEALAHYSRFRRHDSGSQGQPRNEASEDATVPIPRLVADCYQQLTELHSASAELEEAVECGYEALRCLGEEPNTEAAQLSCITIMGLALIDLGRYEEALAILSTGYNTAGADVQASPLVGRWKAVTGIALLFSSRFEEAIETFHDAIPRDASSPMGLMKAADSYKKVGLSYQGLRKYEESVESYEIAIDICSVIPDATLVLADSYLDYAASLGSFARYEEAIQMCQTALPLIGEGAETSRQRQSCLIEMGSLYDKLGNKQEADKCYLKAEESMLDSPSIPKWQKAQTPMTLKFLYPDGITRNFQGREVAARYSDVLARYEQTRREGFFVKALLELESFEKELPEGELADTLKRKYYSQLGKAYATTGRIEEALREESRALALLENVPGQMEYSYPILKRMAEYNRMLHRFDESEKLYREALDLVETAQDIPSEKTDILVGIGWLRMVKHEYETAIEYFKEAVSTIRNETGEVDHITESLCSLGVALNEAGQHEAARESFDEAIMLAGRNFNDHITRWAQWNIGLNALHFGDASKTINLWSGIADQEWTILHKNLPLMTPAEKATFCAMVQSHQPSVRYALAFSNLADPAQLAKFGLESAFTYKAILSPSAAARPSQRGSDPLSEAERVVQQLAAAKRQHATLAHALENKPDSSNLDDVSQPPERERTVSEEIARLQKEILYGEEMAARSNPLEEDRAGWSRPNSEEVAEHLPPGSVLIDYVSFCKRDLVSLQCQGVHYGAFILAAENSQVQAIDLGPASLIDATIHDYLREVRKPLDQSRNPGPNDVLKVRRIGTCLRNLIFDPLNEHVKQAQRLYVSPTGSLALLPFESLPNPNPDGSDRWLAEVHEIIYLTCGRDILTHAAGPSRISANTETNPKPASTYALLLGNPDYEMTETERLNQILNYETVIKDDVTESPSVVRPHGANGDGKRWEAIPSTGDFLEGIALELQTFGMRVKVLQGKRATEEDLAKYPQPRILQFATHGWFLPGKEERQQSAEDDLAFPFEQPREPQTLLESNPLLCSMLILSGANRRGEILYYKQGDAIIASQEYAKFPGPKKEGPERLIISDGLLTAEEVTTLDLRGTEIVILTGCETGLGQIQSGIGVTGLRQAFTLAGAASLIMSLWPAPTTEALTQTLTFYDEWLSGEEKYKAFHKSQLHALNQARAKHNNSHPLYWAGFIYAGDPNNRYETTQTVAR